MEIRSNEMKQLIKQIEEEILEITDNKYSIKKPNFSVYSYHKSDQQIRMELDVGR